ncbi:hypothetical protein DB346_06950 [Verrucomicrobia bacterium LW23]|nr:hypothetical protein DB346_06950 [Verrucomicrobia bacterium LW23]
MGKKDKDKKEKAKKPRIRTLALGVFWDKGRILVNESFDKSKQQTFYRSLGGGIEFGETGADALARELKEEIGAEISNIRYLFTVENIFTYEGELGHEIILFYDATFIDESIYEKEVIHGQEDGGEPIKAMWKSIDDFDRNTGGLILYPDEYVATLRGIFKQPYV